MYLRESKRNLSALGYILRRLIEFQSAWILLYPEYEDKTTIGLSIGRSGRMLKCIHERLKDMITIEPEFVCPSKRISTLFDQYTNETNIDNISIFQQSLTHALFVDIKSLSQEIHSLFDRPTKYILREIETLLEEQIYDFELAQWPTGNPLSSVLFDYYDTCEKWGDNVLRPNISLSMPHRPLNLEEGDRSIVQAKTNKELIESQDQMKRMFHLVYAEIEVPATEVCAKSILDFGRSMPLEFTCDMARQCFDESRHAIMMRDTLSEYGGKLGDYSYRNHVWISYMKGRTLEEKLAIQQVIAEGNGIDISIEFDTELQKAGLLELSNLFQFLIADETLHCLIGNKWLLYLLNNSEDEYARVIKDACDLVKAVVPSFAPVNIVARLAAGYPNSFIEQELVSAHPSDKKDLGKIC